MGLPVAFTTLLVAFAFGLALMAAYYMIGGISGCHINPAVSLAMLITKRMSVKDFFGYIIGQFVGGIAGAALLSVIIGGRTSLGGDMLSGIILALLAQGVYPFDAAVLGAYIHGAAGDAAARELSLTSMLASDCIAALPRVTRNLER